MKLLPLSLAASSGQFNLSFFITWIHSTFIYNFDLIKESVTVRVLHYYLGVKNANKIPLPFIRVNPILTTGGADYQALRDSQSEEVLGNGQPGQLAFHMLALQIYYKHESKLARILALFERDGNFL